MLTNFFMPRGLRQLLLRSVEKVTCEWALICTAHNLIKFTSRGASCRPAHAAPADLNTQAVT